MSAFLPFLLFTCLPFVDYSCIFKPVFPPHSLLIRLLLSCFQPISPASPVPVPGFQFYCFRFSFACLALPAFWILNFKPALKLDLHFFFFFCLPTSVSAFTVGPFWRKLYQYIWIGCHLCYTVTPALKGKKQAYSNKVKIYLAQVST